MTKHTIESIGELATPQRLAELQTEAWADQLYGDPWGDLIRAARGCQHEFSIIIGNTAYQRLVQCPDTAPRFQQWFGSALAFPQNMSLSDYTPQRSVLLYGRQCILSLVGILTGASTVSIGTSDEYPCDIVVLVDVIRDAAA